ncbi:MAG: dTDP-4-dehydrorhamnose reductase [Deltaproteobacteria bacterium]|jgi:dTDP-4-dehydrorhamnose reductase|nr:dTDP-4-dehydrorhamnose reductase [Deltaproteobacteria bacterium]
MTSRWLIAGCRGQLGHALVERLGAQPGCEVVAAVDRDELDLADPQAVATLLDGLASDLPQVAVNAAAFTQVDRCEREPEAAERGNAIAPGVLAEACEKRGIRLVHISTDYVFSGDSPVAYREQDEPKPRSVYGRTKLAGEERVLTTASNSLIVRTSWLFGRGRNFIASILAQAREQRAGRASGPLRVVGDQYGRPTYAHDLAQAILFLVERGAQGIYHVANHGVATWWELARASLDGAGYEDLSVERIRTDELRVDAPRPLRSVLDCAKAEALGVEMRDWRAAVGAYLASSDSPMTNSEGSAVA